MYEKGQASAFHCPASLISGTRQALRFSLSIGEQSGKLQYDAAAERALMLFPPSTRTSLLSDRRELQRSPIGGESAAIRSLLQVLDCTVSAAGKRQLRAWLRHPITSVRELQARHGMVGALVGDAAVRSRLRDRSGRALHKMPDIERLAAKLEGHTEYLSTKGSIETSLNDVLELYRALQRSRAVLEALESLELPGDDEDEEIEGG